MPRNGVAQRNKVAVERSDERGLEAIIRKIRDTRNVDFRNYKRGTLLRRVQRRMQDRGKRTMREYSALLDRDPKEVDALIGAMLIKVIMLEDVTRMSTVMAEVAKLKENDGRASKEA